LVEHPSVHHIGGVEDELVLRRVGAQGKPPNGSSGTARTVAGAG